MGSSIVKDAKRQADEIIADANAQSAKVIDSIQMRAEREKMNLSHLQKEVATFKNQLLALYKNHLELISSLPENTKSEETASEDQEEQDSMEQEALNYEKEEMPASAEESVPMPEESPVFEKEPLTEERESRFGPLKFGAGYDLKRDR